MASAPPMEEEEAQNLIRNPDLPFVSAIVGGLFPGRAIVISGLVLPSANDAKRFHIDLCCGLLIQGDHMDNKALHINPRFDSGGGWFSGQPDRQLVINSYISSKWGAEERFPNPFEPGKPFQIRILVLQNYFKIAVNGKHVCDYPHRVPISDVKTIYVGGNIRVDFIEFQPAVRVDDDGKPILDASPEKHDEKVTTIDRPDTPFTWQLPSELGGFVTPQTLRFTLTPFMRAKRFNINLMAAEEYAFHFRVDFRDADDKASRDAVVRNSTKGSKWQKEERDITTFPFSRGITCDIQFVAYGSTVAVDVDGTPFIKFKYRDASRAQRIEFFLMRSGTIH
ncbi:hypothetical protein Q1695_004197 [Nippostrongylus brasiliensis]|nr:hypothetical protein Q1695_004197 [Nippostrongylus brasiliensis]